MKQYDNYNPEIPYADESPAAAEVLARHEEKKSRVGQSTRKGRGADGKRRNDNDSRRSRDKVSDGHVESIWMRVKTLCNAQTFRLLLGIFLGCLGIYLAICFVSYFSECVGDQSIINSTAVGDIPKVGNAGGEGGARLSEFLINECFGVGSLVIVIWLLAMSLKQLVGRPRFKSVNFTIKCLVALITLSLIVGLLTIGFGTSVNWGGYHGRYVNEFIVGFVGWSGAALLSLFMMACFVAICMRDVIRWAMRLRRERLRKKKEQERVKAERLAREREMEEMRRREAADAARAGEALEPEEDEIQVDSVVDFDSGETGKFYELPDEPELSVDTVISDSGDDIPVDYGNVSCLDIADDLPEDVADVAELPVNGDIGQDSDVEADVMDSEEKMKVTVGSISQVEKQTDAVVRIEKKPYHFPPFDLLKPGSEKISVDPSEQLENKENIRKTLSDYGIPIVSIEATVGPTITLYEIVPDRGVKTSKIRSLVDDIALRLSAKGVRIIAPIPGKGTVGIEVANREAQTVSMQTIIKSRKYQETKYKLPIALGSTINNDVFIADLAKMPHLLVAGATGQGKSVGLNAIITSLLYKKSPEDLKFVMIDPKMVEFSIYSKIEKHYLAKLPVGSMDNVEPIITDMTQVVATLSSLCVEMDNRYKLLKAAHTRNIEEYNGKWKARTLSQIDGHRYLPYIVVIVDEFSDLIMTSGKEVETPIARLAQKGRAAGMHVIIATQRPSTNVITGIIKANFPARIAFKVSSGIDSKTILDTSGAQALIGRGDMLISNNSEMTRVQCAFVDTPEVEDICDFIEQQPGGEGAYILPEPIVSGGDTDSEPGNSFGERDQLFEEVARLVVSSNTASTSSLQRRYSIGYNRAGKIMDQLEAAGIVGPSHGGKPRTVLIDAYTLESILNPHGNISTE